MKNGTVIAVVIGSVVLLGGGVATAMVLRKRSQTGGVNWQVQPDASSRQLAAVQTTMGAGAVAKGAPPAASVSLGSTLIGAGSAYANSIVPGSGAIVGKAASVTTGVLSKVPGVGSLGKALSLW
jgi:hypothetical protein